MKTTEKLAAALRAAGAPPRMIECAAEGYYYDYETPLAMPINQLVADARKHGLDDIAKRAINGEFDATREESDEWYERESKQLVQNLPPAMRRLFEGRPKEE